MAQYIIPVNINEEEAYDGLFYRERLVRNEAELNFAQSAINWALIEGVNELVVVKEEYVTKIAEIYRIPITSEALPVVESINNFIPRLLEFQCLREECHPPQSVYYTLLRGMWRLEYTRLFAKMPTTRITGLPYS